MNKKYLFTFEKIENMQFFGNSHLQNYAVTMTENATELSQTSSDRAPIDSKAAPIRLTTSQKKSIKKSCSL